MKTPSLLLLLSFLRFVLICCVLSAPLNLINAADGSSLIKNGDMQADSNQDGRPDRWGNAGNGQEYLTEGGNTFLRMTSNDPSKMVMHYLNIDIPKGVRAMELSWDWRVNGLKKGSAAWHDARIMLKVLDTRGKPMKTGAGDPATRGNFTDWKSKSVQILVPEGAYCIEIMPSLCYVRSGTFDLDNVSLKPIDPEALIARMEERAKERARLHVDAEEPDHSKWPSELKVVGNRLQNAEGKEVWLQGINVPSLEWNEAGENVLKSAQVAIEEWGANCLRLPVQEASWFGKNGSAYKKRVNDVIVYAANRGVYTVLDLHRYRAPRVEHLDFWKDAATIYKNNPAVIFDLMNEPHGVSWEIWRNGGFVEEKTKKADEDAFLSEEERLKNKQGFESVGMQGLLEAVRSTGARNVIVAGGLDWAYDLSGILKGYALEDTADGNGIMYSTHVYPWKRGWQKSFLDAAELYPILVGEVGADAKKMDFMPHEIQEDWDTWVPSMLGVIQKYKLNWTAWCFHPSASPRMLLNWHYEPTPYWGKQAKEALGGKSFHLDRLR